jgi:hypothetical protein
VWRVIFNENGGLIRLSWKNTPIVIVIIVFYTRIPLKSVFHLKRVKINYTGYGSYAEVKKCKNVYVKFEKKRKLREWNTERLS